MNTRRPALQARCTTTPPVNTLQLPVVLEPVVPEAAEGKGTVYILW